MPRKTDHPIPKKRFHGDRWRIYWYWNKRQYSIATPHTDPKKTTLINHDLRLFIGALAQDPPLFPTEYQNDPGVIAYMKARFPEPDPVDSPAPVNSDWLADYEPEIKSEVAAKWAAMSIKYLRDLDKATGLASLTPESASKYLSGIAATHKIATRNRLLAIFSRFFGWAVRTERIEVNPFAGIKVLKEEKPIDAIVYCTIKERTEIIAMAQATEWPEWIAIPIAFYSGMRREEVANLEWPDVRFAEDKIIVGRSKNKKGRITPLNPTLKNYLQSVPESERFGHVVKIPDGIDRLWRLDNLVRKIQKLKKANMLSGLSAKKPLPSRSAAYKEQRAAYEAEEQKLLPLIEAALERIGWNSFRHTFGSILAQKNISIDKISSWMGNTPEVCRRHYAQFVPRGQRDEDIDALG